MYFLLSELSSDSRLLTPHTVDHLSLSLLPLPIKFTFLVVNVIIIPQRTVVSDVDVDV